MKCKPCINEKNFNHEERYKEWNATLDDDCMHGKVEWLTQECEHHSDRFTLEVHRAFKEAGAKDGCVIEVAYGSRDYGLKEHFEIIV